MELLLLWALTYALVHATRQTWRHGKAAMTGRPLPTPAAAPSGIADAVAGGVEGAAAGGARAAGSIWQAAGDGWRAGWHQGRTTRAQRGRWQPWTTPPPFTPRPASPPPPRDPDPADTPGRPRQHDTPPVDDLLDDLLDADQPDGPYASGAPRCWSQLAPDEQRGIVADVAATGRSWAELSVDEAATWIRRHLRIRYGVFRLATDDILRAQANYDDPTWRTGPAPETPPPTAQAPRPDPTSTAADDDVIDAEIVAPRCWSQLAPDEQQQIREGTAATGQRWDDLPDPDRDRVIAGWISAVYRVDLSATDVAAAQAAQDADGQAETGPPAADSTSPTPVLVAPDLAASAAGIPTHEGDLMTTGSGETTNIAAARTYYEQLAGHAESDIASRIEMSRTYMTAAQLSDPGVLSAIAHAQETAGLLAAASRGVVQALEAHRLMEEAVASTPGAASTDFYRPA